MKSLNFKEIRKAAVVETASEESSEDEDEDEASEDEVEKSTVVEEAKEKGLKRNVEKVVETPSLLKGEKVRYSARPNTLCYV